MTDAFDRLKAALADRYAIDKEIGAGGMATVYLAEDLKLHRKVALKVLKPDLAAALGPERFLQEIDIAAKLNHPHILGLHDCGEAHGFLYYVMPYIEGESLREKLASEGELPVADAVRILKDVVDALAEAHSCGVVHRDIKPDNIMLSGRHALVTDFGVAKAVSEATGRQKLTTEGIALGTPAYMAPEQAAADPHIDHRADIYAVGAVAYELLTGRPPFTGTTQQEILAAQVTQAAESVTKYRDTVPPALAQLVMKCLEKKPADRWQTAEELIPQLEALATPSGGMTPTSTRPFVATRLLGKETVTRMAFGGAAVLVAAFAFAVWLGTRDPVATGDAEASASVRNDSGFVVLPFVDQTGIDSLQTFGAVLADYVTGQVSRNGIGLVVPGQTVRDLAAGREEATDAVAYYSESTGARYVVTGTYYQQGASLIVQAEVTDGRTSMLVSSVGPIVGSMSDFMATIRSSAEQILVVLARIINPDAAPPSVAGMPATFAAYQDFVEGQELWGQGDRARALELFYRALEADSTYAEALLMASVTEWNVGDIPKADSIIQIAHRYRSEMAPWDVVMLDWLQGWFDGDREAVYRAGRRWAELEPTRGGDGRGARMSNHLRQAVEDGLKWYDRSFDKTGLLGFFWTDFLTSLHLLGAHATELEHARTARRYNPSQRSGFTFEARALAALGRVDELGELLDEAKTHASDFSVGRVIYEAGLDLRVHGRRELGDELIAESVGWFESRGDTNTTYYPRSLFANGDYEKTLLLSERRAREVPDHPAYLGLLGSAAAALGDRETALAASEQLVELEALPYTFGGAASWRALIVAQLGDRDEAVRLLQVAYEEGVSYGIWLHNWPQLAGLRDYPPFERFIAPRE